MLYTFQIVISIGVIGNIIFGTVWGIYFLLRINTLRKKVYYLKKQTDERCFDELKNAKVDYIKSIFIAAISAFEVLTHLGLVEIEVFQNLIKVPIQNCSSQLYIEYSFYSPLYRVIAAFAITSVIVFLSLIHILTSYLSHAYSEKRITNIMRRERVMFAWLFIQLVCVWYSIFYWPLFILTLPIMVAIALIGHVCLYWKYGRELYSVIRRRERDALFEDVHTHRKLSEMLKDYKIGFRLYMFYAQMLIFAVILTNIKTGILSLTTDNCVIKKHFHLDTNILTGIHNKEILL